MVFRLRTLGKLGKPGSPGKSEKASAKTRARVKISRLRCHLERLESPGRLERDVEGRQTRVRREGPLILSLVVEKETKKEIHSDR